MERKNIINAAYSMEELVREAFFSRKTPQSSICLEI
jgi:hypothetical protein